MAEYIVALASEARTADTTSKVFDNWQNHEAAHIVVDVTVGSPNLDVYVKGRDEASDQNYTLLQAATINGGTTVLKIGPAYTAGANVAKDYMPYKFLIDVVQSGGVSATYSVGVSLI